MRKRVAAAVALLLMASFCSAGTTCKASLKLWNTNKPGTPPATATVFLAHLNGTDGGTSATDAATGGNAPHTITFQGTAALDDAQVKFGTTSLYTNGIDGRIDVTDAADLDLTGSYWTMEFFLRFHTLPGDVVSWRIISKYTGAANRSYVFQIGNNAGYDGTRFTAYTPADGTLCNILEGTISDYVVDKWYHIAIVRNGDDVTVYRDGLPIMSVDGLTDPIQNCSTDLSIGWYGGADCWFDEVRISAIARYTSRFSPPSSEFSP